jgi:hypothetical protein
MCFGGILRFYAELRRELKWGNFKLELFWVLLVGPRRFTEEGGQLVLLLCIWGSVMCQLSGFNCVGAVGVTYELREGEGFP